MNASGASRLLRRIAAEARHIPETILLVWTATHVWTVAWLALLLVQGILPAAAVYLTRGAVDAVVAAVNSRAGTTGARDLALTVAPLAAVLVLQAITTGVLRWVRFHQSERLQDFISGRIHEQSVAVRLRFYDFPEYFDHLHRARDEAAFRPSALLDVAGGLLQNAITSAGVAIVIAPYGLWLPFVLIAGSIPPVLLVLRNSLRRQDWKRRSTAAVRRTHYLEWLVTTREAAAEVRLFNLGAQVIRQYQQLRASLVREESQLVRREAVAELAASLLGLVVAGGVAAWVIRQAIEGRLSTGSLALFFAAFLQGQALARSALDNAAQVYMNSLFLGDLFEFLGLEREREARTASRRVAADAGPGNRLEEGLRFEGVVFAYPGTNRHALAGFSMDVPAGRTVAIVGPNGAGKSTIIKLLCRFYDPDQGRIVVDGRDIADRSPTDVRAMVSALFQDSVHYSATVAENVSPAQDSASQSRLEAAVRAAGAEHLVARLPRGYDTLLGTWFDEGTELSGGEWRRLALARAVARDTPILLLDEPTSAMDSWAEADWFSRLRVLAVARTTIIITHRFTTAMQADVIHVMDEGRIVETGAHEQLLAAGGRYAESWRRQTGSENAQPHPPR